MSNLKAVNSTKGMRIVAGIRISKSVPVPEHARSRTDHANRKPAGIVMMELEPGESFLSHHTNRSNASELCTRYGKKLGRKFVYDLDGEVYRIWRVK